MVEGHSQNARKENRLVPIILLVAILGYGIGFALRAEDHTNTQLEQTAGPGYTEPLPSIGPENAPVVLIAVGDLRCIYCMKRNALVKRLMVEHEEDIQLIFKHFPFVSPQYSERGAIAAMAAQRQHRFWDYVDYLYLHRKESWSDTRLTEYAEDLGLDTTQFESALTDPSLASYVRLDRAAAETLNIRATPTLLVNGMVVPNWANAYDVRKMIRTSRNEVAALIKSGQATDNVEARAIIAAKNHPAGETFARRYMLHDVSDLGEALMSQ